ncbi:hypothetical protein D7Z54_33340 [Salibacterium salarium]|uniref:DUF3221 domain-containing protein n=1 Tax=Salibacterium salarium TaxID=284579 RepID=A0A3R9P1S3_9BACI|nr:hypothetical protein [Salibacterium salarium]RSL29047.1 hypothetical protein D7Z54_33340 [Salibacterium salarium]
MKKQLAIAATVILLSVMGCSNENDAHYEGTILEIKENSIIVGEDDIDPEASYPTYEILIDDKTEFNGEVEKFENLNEFVSETEHPIVKLWVIDKGTNNEIDNRIASKVVVEKE